MREWLKKCRDYSGITPAQMADKLDISSDYYAQIESGTRQKNMDITLIAKLSAIFGLPLQRIIELEEQ